MLKGIDKSADICIIEAYERQTTNNGENKMRFITLILEVLDFIRETIEYKIQK